MNMHNNNNGIGERSPEERSKLGSKVVSLKRGMLVHVRPWRHQRNMRLITEPCLRAHNRSSPLSKYFYSIFPQIIHFFSLPLFCVSLRTDELWSSKKDQLRLAINTNMKAEFVRLWACHSSGEDPNSNFNVQWEKQHRTHIRISQNSHNLMFFWPCIMNWLYINYQLDALIIIYS